MSSWKSNCLVYQVFRLPGCGKLLNVPVQLDFLERIMDDTELFNSYVELCEKKFVEGDPHFKKYELSKSFVVTCINFSIIFRLPSIYLFVWQQKSQPSTVIPRIIQTEILKWMNSTT